MIEKFLELINTSFIEKHVLNHGYNIVSATTYMLIFVLITVVIYLILKRKNIDLDYKFALATIPHLVFFTALRVMEDQKLFPRTANPLNPFFYTISPGIWFLALAFILVSFFISRKISKKLFSGEYKYKIFAIFSFVLIPFLIIDLLNFNSWLGVGILIGVTAVFSYVVFFILKKHCKTRGLVKEGYNKLCIFSHSMDSLVPFTSNLCVGGASALLLSELFLFSIGRIFIVLVFIYLVDRTVSKKEQRHLLKFVCFVVGLAPALKDLFLIGIQF